MKMDMKKICVSGMIICAILAGYCYTQAGNYYSEAEDIVKAEPHFLLSCFKAFLDGFTLGLTGGGDIFAEAHRQERVEAKLLQLKKQYDSSIAFGNFFLIISIVALLGTIYCIYKEKKQSACTAK